MWRGLAVLSTLALAAFWPRAASAQEPRLVLGADLGAATTWDDEGMLGRGAAVAGSMGLRIIGGLTLQALVDHVPYHRNAGYLQIEGRFTYVGAEAAYRFGNGAMGAVVVGGAGGLHYADTWIYPGPGGTSAPLERIPHGGTIRAVTFGGGLDVAAWRRASIRPLLRVYMAVGELQPTLSVRPGVGVAVRW